MKRQKNIFKTKDLMYRLKNIIVPVTIWFCVRGVQMLMI